jgi:hypothetical protein
MHDPLERPAHVRQAEETADSLGREAQEELRMARKRERGALCRYRNIGQILARAKKRCKDEGRPWLEFLRAHLGGVSESAVNGWIAVAQNWDSVEDAASLAEALRILAAAKGPANGRAIKFTSGTVLKHIDAALDKAREWIERAADGNHFDLKRRRDLARSLRGLLRKIEG